MQNGCAAARDTHTRQRDGIGDMFDYKGKRWQRKQKGIMRRDRYMCQWCKRYGRNVQATVVHHIEHADTHPELGYTDSNLISLCAACHNKAHPEKANKARRCR